MSNLLDFKKLSTFFEGIVDRKTQSLALLFTSSANYLKSLSTSAATSAATATQAQLSTSQLYSNFLSTYLGVLPGDPQPDLKKIGAFYTRLPDKHLRVAIGITNGLLVWSDAVAEPNSQSVLDIVTPRFLNLNSSASQTVTGTISFTKPTTVGSVDDWASSQATTAAGVMNKINTTIGTATQNALTNGLNAETTRATNAENALGSAINAESSRASLAENHIASALNDESTRAQAAESSLTNSLPALVASAKTSILDGFKSGSNSNGNWELRQSGSNTIIEQDGIFQTTSSGEPAVTVTLPLTMPNADYNISISPFINNNNVSCDTWVQIIKSAKTTSNFGIQYQHPGDSSSSPDLDGFEWRIRYTLVNSSVPPSTTTTTNTNTGSSSGSGSTGDDGGTVNSDIQYDPYCPEAETPVLLSNTAHTGPGRYTRADSINVGDWLWTRHEHTMVWGAYEVTHARTFEAMLWEAPNYYKATEHHPLYLGDQWVGIETIGKPSGNGLAVGLTVHDAHTYITLDRNGNQVLNHNTKPTAG